MKGYIRTLLLVAVLLAPVYVNGQGFEDDEDVADQVPLDGGLSLLAAGGVAYGVKKWKDLKKKQ